MKTFITFLLAIAITTSLVVAIKYAIESSEMIECLNWQEEVDIYYNYYLTDWQVEQCENYGIELDV